MRPYRHAALVLSISLLLSGCITSYSGFDRQRLDQAPSLPQQAGSLRYSIYGNSLLNGQIAVRSVFDHETPFAHTEQLSNLVLSDGNVGPATIPASGLYVKASIENMPPSIPAGIAAYVSYSTLFLLPFWSTEDGSRLLFDVYRDGQHQRRFEYPLHRHTYGWTPLLLLIWLNALNPGEQDAFRAATRSFLVDAAPLLQMP